MSYNDFHAAVLADSVTEYGVRATTFEVTFPRFILAEVNTHRQLSRNSASSRAIPPERQIKRVVESPFVPLTFLKRVKGMGGGDPLSDSDQDRARQTWLNAAVNACRSAETLIRLDCDKARINRLLEPFLWHTAILTGTEWSNFFALRTDEAAQPEFRVIADMMQDAMEASSPQTLKPGQWHLPLVDPGEVLAFNGQNDPGDSGVEVFKRLSVRRCARVSFDKHLDTEDVVTSLERVAFLETNGHVSPFEHQLRPLEHEDIYGPHARKLMVTVDDASGYRAGLLADRIWCGNVRGFWQFRKEIAHEEDFSKVKDELALGGV